MSYLKMLLLSLVFTTGAGTTLLETWYQVKAPQKAVEPSKPQRVPFVLRLTVGYGEPLVPPWKGSLQVEDVDVSELRGWEIDEDDDRISLNGFELDAYNRRGLAVRKGFVMHGSAGPEGRISVQTNNGSFSFRIADLSKGTPLWFLQGRVRVEGLPQAVLLTDQSQDDDYPTVAVAGDTAWVAWQSYQGKNDEIRVARREKGWGTFTRVPGTSGDVWRPRVGVAAGRLWVVWSQQVDGNFDVYARALAIESNEWQELVRLTTQTGPDIDADLAVDSRGGLWVVWQAFQEGNSDVFLRHFDGERWLSAVPITTDPANDWAPRVATDAQGTAYVVWDSYREGSYDVFLRTSDGLEAGPLVTVAATPRFEAHASVAVDRAGRVWVAWDEGGANWGKDTGLTVREDWLSRGKKSWDEWIHEPSSPGTRLYEARRIQLAVFEGTERRIPADDLQEAMQRSGFSNFDYPLLVSDPESDTIALVCHLWSDLMDLKSVGVPPRIWTQGLISYDGQRWSEVVEFPESQGRPSGAPDAAFGPAGNLWAVWATDGRQYKRTTLHPNGNIYAAPVVVGQDSGMVRLEEWKAPAPLEVEPIHPREKDQIKRVRSYRTFVQGVENRIVRGDLHRHGEFSWDSSGGNVDGSLFDYYRYMLDAASMDFGGITDHYGGATYDYWWWLTEKSCDMFQVPGGFTTLYGYERSVSYPGGHRNIFHTIRGVPIVPFFTDPETRKSLPNVAADNMALENDTPLLYEALRRSGGIAIPHTTGSKMGTDWRYHDPDVEPAVEIFQGDRTSYETPGAPRAVRDASDRPIGGFYPDGYVWNAYRKGYRIGTIASSDHWSTHISYAMVFTEQPTRDAIFEGIKKRHTYGATDNIVLDYRMGEYFMGDDGTVAQVPPLQIHILGTSRVSLVEVIKNEMVIYSAQPESDDVSLTFLDQEPTEGLNYYYVRVQQDDRQIAWGSPIWVTLQP